MKDLKDSRLIYFKAILFLTVLVISAFLILMENFSWKNLGLLCLVVWSATRLYYFMFYVIEKYVDPGFKFSGILSFIAYVVRRDKQH